MPGAHLMRPIVDERGALRADLDHRLVSRSVMCAYLGISPVAFWKRWIAGVYPREGGQLIGAKTWYRPRVIMAIDQPQAAGKRT